MKRFVCLAILALGPSAALADSSSLDAAIGGGLGGAAGAVIGNEVGGRNGAIIGGAVGGGLGAAVATGDDKRREAPVRGERIEYHRHPARQPAYHFCPPGQAKKGRC